mmetsp:Transcript_14615/g.49158  ORF Transcript_14615/g.49158 Transcript_14615/m.49158 type:complete len:231 (+) Transcript_14615:1111-1803(+)
MAAASRWRPPSARRAPARAGRAEGSAVSRRAPCSLSHGGERRVSCRSPVGEALSCGAEAEFTVEARHGQPPRCALPSPARPPLAQSLSREPCLGCFRVSYEKSGHMAGRRAGADKRFFRGSASASRAWHMYMCMADAISDSPDGARRIERQARPMSEASGDATRSGARCVRRICRRGLTRRRCGRARRGRGRGLRLARTPRGRRSRAGRGRLPARRGRRRRRRSRGGGRG